MTNQESQPSMVVPTSARMRSTVASFRTSCIRAS